MSANHHDPVIPGADVNVLSVNGPLGQLDSRISRMGEQINVGDGTSLSVTDNTITKTRSRHVIITGGTSKTITTISGGATGDLLLLRIDVAARVAFTNTNNIQTRTGVTIYLRNPREWLLLLFNGGFWQEVGASTLEFTETGTFFGPIPTPSNIQISPRLLAAPAAGQSARLEVTPTPVSRSWFLVRAAAGDVTSIGIPAVTTSGTKSHLSTTGIYTNFLSGSSAGNIAGYVSASFNLTNFALAPEFTFVFETGSDVSNLRLWVGLTTAALTNVDDPAGATKFIGFRYSTVAGDAQIQLFVDTGSTTFNISTSANVLANTRYVLRLRINSVDNLVNGNVNGLPEVEAPSFTPNQDFGIVAYAITTTNSAKNIRIGSFYVEMD